MDYTIVYLPVLHSGYIEYLELEPKSKIKIIDQSLVDLIDSEFDYLRKEVRSLNPEQSLKSLESILPNREISLLSKADLRKIDTKDNLLLLPDEDIFRWLSRKHITKAQVKFADTFLRWNRENTTEKQTIVPDKKLKELTFATQKKAQLSSDWWRQVAATIFEEDEIGQVSKLVVSTYNKHLPHEYIPYFDSDPRNSFHKGQHIELSTAIHAESAAIAWCAKNGAACEGLSMYVTTFPCPVCAKLIAQSGIKKLYFTEGYSMLDGEKILKSANITVVKI